MEIAHIYKKSSINIFWFWFSKHTFVINKYKNKGSFWKIQKKSFFFDDYDVCDYDNNMIRWWWPQWRRRRRWRRRCHDDDDDHDDGDDNDVVVVVVVDDDDDSDVVENEEKEGDIYIEGANDDDRRMTMIFFFVNGIIFGMVISVYCIFIDWFLWIILVALNFPYESKWIHLSHRIDWNLFK